MTVSNVSAIMRNGTTSREIENVDLQAKPVGKDVGLEKRFQLPSVYKLLTING